MQALTDSGVFWVMLFMAIIVLYLLPTLIGAVRGVDGLTLVFLVNLIGAPAAIGWLGCNDPRVRPASPSPCAAAAPVPRADGVRAHHRPAAWHVGAELGREHGGGIRRRESATAPLATGPLRHTSPQPRMVSRAV